MSDKTSNKTSDKRLKRCPFCGGEAGVAGYKYMWVECNGCGASTTTVDCREDAIKVWNTRKPVDDVVEALENASYTARCFNATVDYLNLDMAIEIVKEHLT